MNILELNNEVFNSYIWNAPLNMDKILYYQIQSSLPSIKNLRFNVLSRVYDLRVHTAIFMPSGSGKGGMFNYMGELADRIGLNFFPTAQMTDAAIVGTMIQKEVYVSKKHGKELTFEEKPGFLNPSRGIDIVAMNETDILFDTKKTDYAKDMMTWFQKAMNPYKTKDNLITKDLASGRIEFYTNVNLMFISKLPENFYKTITSTGFLQRTIVVYSPVPFHQKAQNDRVFLENVGVSHSDINSKVDTIADYLKQINEHYKYVDSIEYTDEARQVMVHQLHPKMHSPVENVNHYIQSTLGEFISRYQEMAVRIAYHNAISRMSDKVEAVDALNAMFFILPLWENVISFIEEGLKEAPMSKTEWLMKLMKMEEIYLYLVKKATKKKQYGLYIPAKPYFDMLTSREYGWGCTRETAVKRFMKAVAEGYAKKGKKKNMDVIAFVKEVGK